MATSAQILAGDVGGTKIHLGLYHAVGDRLEIERDKVFATADYDGLEAVVRQFVKPSEGVAAACCGVAGPVIDGESRPVNVPWPMRERTLSAELQGAPARLVNDLEATAWGTLYLRDADIVTLQEGAAPTGPATKVIIAAGTGLGEAGLVHGPHGWHVVASEGGHTDFAPRGAEQVALLKFLEQEFGHVSFERVLSGPGLHNIYRFLRSQTKEPEPEWLTAQIRSHDVSAIIGEMGVANRDPLCRRAVEIFCAIYGAESSNLALKYLALGGVFVCGGIAPKLIKVLGDGCFVTAFQDKGRFSDALKRFPIRVSMNQDTALTGAAHVAASMVRTAAS